MINSYPKGHALSRQLRQLGLTALLVSGTALVAHAQFPYTAALTTNVAGTFTDLGATGSVIATATTDDANSAPQDIGFTFNYNGANFTQFVLNTNGLIRLGANPPSKAAAHSTYAQTPELGPANSTDPADVNLIMPFNIDLVAGTAGASYRMALTGTAPNRVCTIRWTNVSDKETNASSTVAVAVTPQYDNFSFQVKLYETSNRIEFIYGLPTAGTGTTNAKYVAVGLKGSGSAAGQNLLGSKLSTALWSTTTFASGPYVTGSNTHNIRQSAGLPDAGRTYRFNQPAATDAGVTAIYTLGKLITPASLPHSVQARVTNAGTTTITNLPVTLSVTGANTFTSTKTVASLAVGASTNVTFDAYPNTLALGTNTVTVTVPADGNASNNSVVQQQLVNSTTVSYIAPDQPTGTAALGYGMAAGILATKFTTSVPLYISSVSDYIVNTSSSPVGHTMYAVILSSTGAILGRSADYVVTAADVETNKSLTITTPPTVPAGDFYVGIAQPTSTTTFYPVGTQVEMPTRAGAFYGFDLAGGTPSDLAGEGYGRLMIEGVSVLPPACSAPTALAASNITSTGATISFTPPTGGGASYQVIYGPTGFDPTAAGTSITTTASPATITGLTAASVYQVYVRTNCTGGGNSTFAGPITISTPCGATVITAFPYQENFDAILAGQSLPCGVTTLDANGDGTTWRISTDNPNSGANDMRYNGLAVNDKVADDWFFTPGLSLTPATSATRYQVAFRYRAAGIGVGTSTYTESLEVRSGLSATVAGQTNLLYNNDAITNLTYALANGTSAPAVGLLPAGTSTQYVGFHAKSIANQGNLYIDDLAVTAVTVTGTTSEAMLKAITVFPNPSATGVFDLEIHGANAKGELDVQVTNTLGQRVYTGSARDNYTNKLDLSTLAAGIYHLRVRSGEETLTRQLSIIK